MKNKPGIIRAATLGLWIVLLIVSLILPAFCTSECTGGMFPFLLGWMGAGIEIISIIEAGKEGLSAIADSGYGSALSWLANPAMFIAALSMQRRRLTSVISSATAILLALSFLAFDRIMNNEAGTYAVITEVQIGYWLWVASALSLFIGCVIYRKLAPPWDDPLSPQPR